MRQRSHPRSGFALASALLTLGIIGALVTGTFFVATHEQRTGTDVLFAIRALGAAELGVESAITHWDREWNVVMQRGDRRQASPTDVEAASATTEIVRLDNQLFLVSAEGWSGSARRVVRRYVGLVIPEPRPRAAAALGGAATVEGLAHIDGTDGAPDGWSCPDPGAPLPGIATPDSALIATDGCLLGPCVTGSPPIAVDSVLRDPHALTRLGDLDWNELVARANATVTGIVSPRPTMRDGACDVEDHSNWGDRQRSADGVCMNHFPLVHAPGDLTIAGGQGQGALLVDGNLTVRGGFHFAGIVVVRGTLNTGPGGGRITGAVSVAAADSAGVSTLRDLVIRFSICAVSAAMLGSALPAPITERSWHEAVDGQ